MTQAAHPPRRAAALALSVWLLACGGGGTGDAVGAETASLFSVSGTITVAGGTAADSDVNDPGAPYAPNDSLSTAAEISNPVTLGGYVNAPGAGPDGRSRVAGDPLDYFHVGLAAGQVVRLFAAETLPAGDLDLALLDLAGTPVATADTADQTEELTVPSTGSFVIEVAADRGGSRWGIDFVTGFRTSFQAESLTGGKAGFSR